MQLADNLVPLVGSFDMDRRIGAWMASADKHALTIQVPILLYRSDLQLEMSQLF